jgi:hypothetical protein
MPTAYHASYKKLYRASVEPAVLCGIRLICYSFARRIVVALSIDPSRSLEQGFFYSDGADSAYIHFCDNGEAPSSTSRVSDQEILQLVQHNIKRSRHERWASGKRIYHRGPPKTKSTTRARARATTMTTTTRATSSRNVQRQSKGACQRQSKNNIRSNSHSR